MGQKAKFDFMSNIGFSEIVLIAILALLFLGPERLPELGQKLGKFWRQFNSAKRQVGQSLTLPDLKTLSQASDSKPATNKNDKP